MNQNDNINFIIVKFDGLRSHLNLEELTKEFNLANTSV